jgi:hypothetical protein
MPALRELEASRTFDAEVRRLRADVAARRLQLALYQFGWSHKAFNPNQPRVPAGNSDGGQWTSEGAAGGRIRLAGPLPPGIGHNQGPPLDELPELPKQRPSTSEGRTGGVKEAVRRLARYGGPIGRVVGAAIWLYEYDAKIEAALDPPKSLDELQQAVASPKPGYHKHHIVERTSAEKDGYPKSLIDGADNVALIPALRHEDITAWYNTNNKEFGGLSPREYLRGKSWDERRRMGLDAMIRFEVLKP